MTGGIIISKQKLLGLCILLILLATVAQAVTVSEETSIVSRMIGNSPEDIINQLDTEEINLNHASYYGTTLDEYTDDMEVLNAYFPSAEDRFSTINWKFDDLLFDLFTPNELFILGGNGYIDLEETDTLMSRIYCMQYQE